MPEPIARRFPIEKFRVFYYTVIYAIITFLWRATFEKRKRIVMKYLLIIGDGMADNPVAEIGGRPPPQAAQNPPLYPPSAGGGGG